MKGTPVTPPPPTSPSRTDIVALRDRPSAQVLVIGGGINGIATFRDLALQGIDVVLVERGDFVSGASSASSHMIHGGVRYLENGEFRLVKESVAERNGLLKSAPHYVHPLETTIPIFSTLSGILSAPLRFLTHKQGRPKARGALLIKVGLTIYDTFSRDGGSVPRHRFHGAHESLRELPRLNPSIKYTATYYDASMHDPERLALDVLRDGQATGNARAVNYVEAVGAGGGVGSGGVRLRDRETGDEFVFTADLVINTSGPWTDLTNAALGAPTHFMGGTKGAHIVLRNDELLAATAGREIFFEHSDGRIVLIYPLKGRILVGTSDQEADPSQPVATTEADIDYFFDLIGHVYPDIAIERSQIVYSFAGIRPLPRHDDEAPGFVSRDYRIEAGSLGDTPMLSLVGGKWTTFRALAEHMTNEALAKLGASRTTSTVGLAIGGGRGYPTTEAGRAEWAAAHADAVGVERAALLLARYGTRAVEVIAAESGADAHPLLHDRSYTRAELAFLACDEQVVHLVDVLMRRTSLAFVGGLTREAVTEVADVVGTELHWSDERLAEEIAGTTRILRESHGVELEEATTTTS